MVDQVWNLEREELLRRINELEGNVQILETLNRREDNNLEEEEKIAEENFTKVLKPVMAWLRSRGFLSVIYLDDILCIAATYDECIYQTQETISFLESLGFILNKKSNLIPSTRCKFLGFIINSTDLTLLLTQEKKERLVRDLTNFSKKEFCKILEIAQILGRLVAACPGVQ